MPEQTLPRFTRRLVLAVTAGLVAGCGAPAYGQAPAAATEVRVTRNVAGLQLDYRFARLQTEFRFNPEEHASEAAVIQVLTPRLALSEGAVVGPAAFRGFSLALLPDTRRVDATYPVLVRVGENGFLFYAPVLAADPRYGRTRFDYRLGAGDTVLEGTGGAGFVFIGPSSYVANYGPLALVTPPALPTPLRATLRERATALLGYYAGRLGRRPPQASVLVVTYDARNEGAGFVGDVTPNGVVLLQLTATLQNREAGSDSLLSRFLAHEFFHLWNGLFYRETAGLNGNWLREGSAEYAGWLAAEALWPEGQSLEERITAQLAPCMNTLGADALVELEDQRSQTTRYSCGAIAHWLADVAIRRAGRGDVLNVWAELLARRRGYDIPSFEAVMRAYARPYTGPLRSVLRGNGQERWPQIFDTLRTWGVHVDEVAPGEGALREAALQTILRETCTGGTTGFETIGLSEPPNEVILRTEPMGDDPVRAECGPLARDPHLLAVNDRSALGSWTPILQEVTAACEARTYVALRLRRGTVEETVRIRCSRSALRPRIEYRVRNALPGDGRQGLRL